MKYLKNLWSNRDNVIVLLPLGSGLLYALGGGGWLVLRRYVLPIYIVLCLFWACRKRTQALLSLIGAFTLSLSFHFGYGDYITDKNVFMLLLIGTGYALATLPFWFIYSRKISTLLIKLFIPAFWLYGIAWANWWGNLEWKIGEGILGVLIGVICLFDIWGSWKK